MSRKYELSAVFETAIDYLLTTGTDHELLEHDPVYTIKQAMEACDNSPEQNVKVLFAKAYQTKGHFFYLLIVWTGNKRADLKQIAESLGVKRTILASPEEVKEELGIEIGALSPFGYKGVYPVVFDGELLRQQELFITPGLHNRTIRISARDLKVIIEQSASSFHLL